MRNKRIELFDVVVYAIAFLLLLVVAYPLLLVVSNSISNP